MIPTKALVGVNSNTDGNKYTDDYLRTLNQIAPVSEVFGAHQPDIANGKNIVGALVMDTLGKREYESHLVAIIMNAARAGSWIAVDRSNDNVQEGLDRVVEKNFGHVTALRGKTYLLPSMTYVAYCSDVLAALDTKP